MIKLQDGKSKFWQNNYGLNEMINRIFLHVAWIAES